MLSERGVYIGQMAYFKGPFARSHRREVIRHPLPRASRDEAGALLTGLARGLARWFFGRGVRPHAEGHHARHLDVVEVIVADEQ